MNHYRLDERGRLFRWDAPLAVWLRILSHDDEYEEASRATVCPATAAVTQPTSAPRRTHRPRGPRRAPSGSQAKTATAVSVRSPRGTGWHPGITGR